MKTTKPISTISYNSKEFLQVRLDGLVQSKVLTSWYFVEHQPEDDEAGLKEHIHLYVVPSKLLQTDDLTQLLLEFDSINPKKPKKCLPWQLSKRFGDWYLYAIHDRAYLAQKGESRRFEYRFEDFIVSDEDDFYREVRGIDLMQVSPYQAMLDAQNKGVTFEEFFARGTVPIPQIRNYQEAWNCLKARYTNRGGRKGHD